jgi:pimeloyl-ACP methyl ester carboxylesterase
MTFDHRGRGASGDFFIDRRALLYPQFLEDAHAALYILWERPEVDTAKVALYGESLGAYLALALAGERPETRAVVAVSPPYSFERWLPVLQRENPDERRFVPEGWKRRWDADKVVNRFNGAILFIGGDRDLTTPAWMAEDLHRRYPRRKELWIVPGAGHAGPEAPARVAGELYYGRIADFLKRELEKAPHRGWPDR